MLEDAVFLGWRSATVLTLECPSCHAHVQAHVPQRPPRPRPPQAVVPRKSITFAPEFRELARHLEDRSRLERTTVSNLACRALAVGLPLTPRIRGDSP